MSKGAATRQSILSHAAGLASQVGLTGLTIGGLADDLRLSKSGLFAHFCSKEALQVEVLEHAAARFTDEVVRPAVRKRRSMSSRNERIALISRERAMNSERTSGCTARSA